MVLTWTQATEQVSYCLSVDHKFFHVPTFFFVFETVNSSMPQDVEGSQISHSRWLERKENLFFTKNTWRIQSFSWKAKATLYNIWSVKLRVEWDKKKQNPRSRYLILPALPTAPPLPLPGKGGIQQTKHIAFINLLKYFPSCGLLPMLCC